MPRVAPLKKVSDDAEVLGVKTFSGRIGYSG